jgi:hypothetical protein
MHPTGATALTALSAPHREQECAVFDPGHNVLEIGGKRSEVTPHHLDSVVVERDLDCHLQDVQSDRSRRLVFRKVPALRQSDEYYSQSGAIDDRGRSVETCASG